MTLLQEMLLAARGIAALVMGRRDAPDYFDLSLRGLAGSAVAFLIAMAANAYLPLLLGADRASVTPPAQAVIMVMLLLGMQIGASYLVLRQIGRLDGLVPYLVADNWATFFVTVVSLIVGLAGIGGDFALLALGVLVIIIEINIARMIVTLKPIQIAAFLIAQLVGVAFGLMLIGAMLPPAATSPG